jgi:hypothetical protein
MAWTPSFRALPNASFQGTQPSDLLTHTTHSFPSKSPCLWASFFHPLSPLWVRSEKEGNFISIWVWNAETQHARFEVIIIGVVQVGAVKIYVAAVEALRKKERQDETQVCHQKRGYFHPLLKANVLFWCRFYLFEYHLVLDQTQGFSYKAENHKFDLNFHMVLLMG